MTSLTIDGIMLAYAPIPQDDEHRASRRRRESATVRDLLRELLGPQITLTHDEHGAPRIEGWHVSITHSARLAAVALSAETPMGIDAEEWRPVLRRTASRFLSPIEQQASLSDADLLAAWTVKEAVYKAAGTPGLAFSEIIYQRPAATAAGREYRIRSLWVDDTLLTLALPS